MCVCVCVCVCVCTYMPACVCAIKLILRHSKDYKHKHLCLK